jgi:hypothetical protein
MEKSTSEILDYKLMRSLIKQANQYRHFGIVLHKDFSLDFYYNLQIVERVMPTETDIFFKIDISHRHLYFSSLDVVSNTIKSYEVLCSWRTRIGIETNHILNKYSLDDLRASLDDINYDLITDDTFSECFANLIKGLLP